MSKVKKMDFIKFLFSKIFWKQVLIAGIGIGVLLFVLFQWLRISTNHSQKIEVPNLSKQPLSEVEILLKDLDLRYVVIDSASYNPDFPKKSVIRQNPEVGDIVKENRQIYLTLLIRRIGFIITNGYNKRNNECLHRTAYRCC